MDVVTPTLVVCYSDLFGSSDGILLDDLVQNYGREDLITYCSKINSLIDSRQDEFDLTKSVINSYESPLKEYLVSSLDKLTDQFHQNPILFIKVSCLALIQFALQREIGTSQMNIQSPETELNLLKAFTLLNETYSRFKSNKLKENDSLPKDLLFLKSMLPFYLPDSEFNIKKNLITQSIKFNMFFEFAECDEKFSKFLPELLAELCVESKGDFLKFISFLYTSFYTNGRRLKRKQVSCELRMDKDTFKEEYKMIQCLTLNNRMNEFSTLNEEQIKDFKLLRKYPFFYDESEDKFILTEINFLADKIFQGLQFTLADSASCAGGKEYEKGLKSEYSDRFVHKYMFHRIMDYCFNRQETTKQSGDKDNNVEYSDYYVRIENKIYLFELKDHIMNSGVKYSVDYDQITSDITKSFVDPAGAAQLIKVIDNISNGLVKFDKFDNPSKICKLKIYPIICYTDNVYGTDGVNYIVNQGFKKLLESKKYPFRIENIVMINFDILIFYQDMFHDGKLSIPEMIRLYLKYLKEFAYDENKSNVLLDTRLFTDFGSFFNSYIQMKKPKEELPRYYQNISKHFFTSD